MVISVHKNVWGLAVQFIHSLVTDSYFGSVLIKRNPLLCSLFVTIHIGLIYIYICVCPSQHAVHKGWILDKYNILKHSGKKNISNCASWNYTPVLISYHCYWQGISVWLNKTKLFTNLCKFWKAGSSNNIHCFSIIPDILFVQFNHYGLENKQTKIIISVI